jgi:hypothetical protein
MNRRNIGISVKKNSSVLTLAAAAIAGALCFPSGAAAQDAYSNTLTCGSDTGQRVTCRANTRNGVRLVRQLSDSPCRKGSTWGYTSRGVWVDRGCQAEFDLSGNRTSSTYSNNTTYSSNSSTYNSNSAVVTCASDNGDRVDCRADTRGGVRMVRQLSGSECRQGSTWGYTSNGIWVDRGCRAEFSLSNNNAYANNSGYSNSNNYPNNSGYQNGPVTRARERIEPGTTITVRTNETINARNSDGRVFTGVVDQDVLDASGGVAIPRGSTAEMIVRNLSNNEVVLDLESVSFNGQRYAVAADADIASNRQRSGVGANKRTGEYVGGGAVLGTILGAIAGGGRGAAIGAAAGAAAGAGTQVLTRGSAVNVPAESLLTFRVEQPLQMGVQDYGVTRDGYHYHPPIR